MANKTLMSKLKQNVSADMISRTRAGSYMFRTGFYYTNGKTARDHQTRIVEQLKALNLSFEVVDCGQVYKDFKGGEPIKNQSHWWVEVNIHE